MNTLVSSDVAGGRSIQCRPEGAWRRRAARWVVNLAVGLAAITGTAWGEPYRELNTNLDANALAAVRSKLDELVEGRSPLAGSENVVRDYVNYIFARFTRSATLADAARDRIALLRMIRSCRSPEVAAALTERCYVVASNFVNPQLNIHPAAKYNAMLILGELNTKEASTGNDRTPPQPLLKALALMLKQVKAPEQSDVVRVGALIGIQRHAQLSAVHPLPAKAKEAIVADMLAIIAQVDPPADRSAEGHDWIRRQAIEVLGDLGETGSGGSVTTALTSVVMDREQPIAVRCSAADALGRLDLSTAPPQVSTTAQGLGRLVVQICREHAKAIKQELRSQGGGYGGYGGSYASPYGAARSSGYGNTGYGNTGYGNTGYGNTGYGRSGARGSSGYGNTGYGNTGYGNNPYGNQRGNRRGRGGRGDAAAGDPALEGEVVEDPLVEITRRVLKYRLGTVKTALNGPDAKAANGGLSKVAQGPDKQMVTMVNGHIDKLLAAVDREKEKATIASIMQAVVDEYLLLANKVGEQASAPEDTVEPEPQEEPNGPMPPQGAVGPDGQPLPGPAAGPDTPPAAPAPGLNGAPGPNPAPGVNVPPGPGPGPGPNGQRVPPNAPPATAPPQGPPAAAAPAPAPQGQ